MSFVLGFIFIAQISSIENNNNIMIFSREESIVVVADCQKMFAVVNMRNSYVPENELFL